MIFNLLKLNLIRLAKKWFEKMLKIFFYTFKLKLNNILDKFYKKYNYFICFLIYIK